MTKIKEIGGEFALIDRVVKKVKDKHVILGPGDDAAIFKIGNKYVAWTTDAIVEGDHFNLKWYNAKQVGMKAIEVNASDIISMGGTPKYALLSIVLKRNTNVEFVDELYNGIYEKSRKYGIKIIGGNFTHGKQIVIDVSMIGFVNKKELCTRAMAQPGDFIFVSGDLGQSTAGLKLYQKNIKGFATIKKRYTNPEAKQHKIKKFIKNVNAMIDISDGLASEVKHICDQSNVGAIIFKDNIPIKQETINAAKKLNMDASDFALYGGEDFELVYTVPEKYLSKVRGFLVGEITKRKGVYIYSKGKEVKLSKKGFDHFK